MSSSTTNSTFGAPSFARIGAGHAGLDSCTVRPMTPGKSLPCGYSTRSLIRGISRPEGARASSGRYEAPPLVGGGAPGPGVASAHEPDLVVPAQPRDRPA